MHLEGHRIERRENTLTLDERTFLDWGSSLWHRHTAASVWWCHSSPLCIADLNLHFTHCAHSYVDTRWEDPLVSEHEPLAQGIYWIAAHRNHSTCLPKTLILINVKKYFSSIKHLLLLKTLLWYKYKCLHAAVQKGFRVDSHASSSVRPLSSRPTSAC